jgi:nucleoside-diphosphate-sugar epimerase
LSLALESVTTIVHLAGTMPSSTNGAAALVRTNVEGTRNLARATCQSSVTLFVHASSGGVYGDGATAVPFHEGSPPAPQTNYERSKLAAEQVLAAELAGSPVRWVVLRPAGVHGPDRPETLRFCRRVLSRRVWAHGSSHVLLHPTYVDDVVDAIVAVLDRPALSAEVFNVAGERPVLYQDLIRIVSRLLNHRIAQITVPAPVAAAVGTAVERTASALRIGVPNLLAPLTRSIVNRALDTSKAQQTLGFRPIPLERGLAETIAWFRRQGSL